MNYGVDSSYTMHVGDMCIAYYDIKNPKFGISEYAVDDYKHSMENMGCMIIFAIVCAWFGFYIKKNGTNIENIKKGLIVVVATLVILFIIVIKNEVS